MDCFNFLFGVRFTSFRVKLGRKEEEAHLQEKGERLMLMLLRNCS